MNTAARFLMALGFKVLPLAPTKLGVEQSGKNPLTAHGVYDATNDFVAFRRLVGPATHFNIAIALGSVSRVVILDIDRRHGGDPELAKLQQRLGPLPRTLTSLTGDGGHLYFRPPPGVRMTKKDLAPGVQLLAEGCYAVAPPSRHWSGPCYRWAEHRGPGELQIAALPASWQQFISGGSQAPNKPTATDGAAIPEGSRNTELTRIAGRLRRAGLSEAEMLAALRGVNRLRCHPPLGDDEVAQIARSVAHYPAGVEARDEGQQIAQALPDTEFAGGEWLRYEKDGNFWSWTGTHWAVIPDKILQQLILKIVDDEVSS
jgi:putative DNA primase/helicase